MSECELGACLETGEHLGAPSLHGSSNWGREAAAPGDRCALHGPRSLLQIVGAVLDTEDKTDNKQYVLCQ